MNSQPQKGRGDKSLSVSLIKIIGLDIGGANTKGAIIQFGDSKRCNAYSFIEYFPFWEKYLPDIPIMLQRVASHLISKTNLTLDEVNYIAITITAELSDAFQTKSEGISKILNALKVVYDEDKMFFISTSNIFLSYKDALRQYDSIAAANWVSTALFLGKYLQDCILIDAGSTTIDVIPILNSNPISVGKTDTERLIHHELIYTGGLRSTIPSITHFVPYRGKNIRISFEKFALVSDVHRILNNITEEEYINDTADNRSKSTEDCYARLARIICLDIDTISKEELKLIANFIYKKQIELITSEISAFMMNLITRHKEFEMEPKFVITGFSADFLIKKALKNLGYTNIYNYEKVANVPERISSSAFAVAGALYHQLLKNNKI